MDIGKIGETDRIVRGDPLGSTNGNGRFARVTITDPVERVIFGIKRNA